MKQFLLLMTLLASVCSVQAQNNTKNAVIDNGITSSSLSTELLMYPNPAVSSITIEIPESEVVFHHLFIYNVMGVLIDDVLISDADNSIVVDLTDYEEGIYYVAITDDNDYNRTPPGKIVKRK